MATVQTFSISFSIAGTSDGYAQVEMDTEKTTFYAGDSVPYRMYLVGTLDSHRSNLGTIAANSTGTRTVTAEIIEFSGAEVTLEYPVTSGLSVAWEGTVTDENNEVVGSPATPTLQGDNRTLACDSVRYGVLSASYTAEYNRYILSGVPTDKTRALIMMKISA